MLFAQSRIQINQTLAAYTTGYITSYATSKVPYYRADIRYQSCSVLRAGEQLSQKTGSFINDAAKLMSVVFS